MFVLGEGSLLCCSSWGFLHFFPVEGFFFFPLFQIKGLRTEGVVCYKDCKGKFGILGYINETDMTWLTPTWGVFVAVCACVREGNMMIFFFFIIIVVFFLRDATLLLYSTDQSYCWCLLIFIKKKQHVFFYKDLIFFFCFPRHPHVVSPQSTICFNIFQLWAAPPFSFGIASWDNSVQQNHTNDPKILVCIGARYWFYTRVTLPVTRSSTQPVTTAGKCLLWLWRSSSSGLSRLELREVQWWTRVALWIQSFCSLTHTRL